MKINITIDDVLLQQAFDCSDSITTKKALIEIALQEYIKKRRIKDLRDLKGTVTLDPQYDYKKMRARM